MIESKVLIELQNKKTEIKRNIAILVKRIKRAPDGSMCVSKKWNQYQYYRKDTPADAHGIYIPRKDHATVVRLAQKDYDIKLLSALEGQLKAIDHFLKHYEPDAPRKVYEKLSEPRKQLISKGFLTDEEYVEQWLSQPYTTRGFSKDDPEFYTAKGERVRSKSEILIADALYRNNIPYRYEYPVYHDGILIAAPDFNCLNVRLRQEHYWEHLGMMGDQNYAGQNVIKFEKYVFADDFDLTKLILTFETEKHPLNTKVIEEIIKSYLL